MFGAVFTSAACFGDITPPRGVQIGGTEYNMNFAIPSPVRLPAATSVVSSRVVAGLRVVDSVIATATGLKELVDPARYQFWVVNGLTGAAWPVTHSLRLTRTDSAFSGGAPTTSTLITNRGNAPFFAGARFNNTIRFKVANGTGADTIGQSGSFLVLTIQSDSGAPAYTGTTPKLLWFRFRDQKNTAANTDDAVFDAPAGTFGSLRSISDSTRYIAQGFGRSAFWDRERDTVLHFSALAIGLPQPPVGYYYQPYARDTRTGAAALFGGLREKHTDTSLVAADLAPARGTLVQLPDARFGVRDDSLQCTFGACGDTRFKSFTAVQLVLEPKVGDLSYPNLTVSLQGTIPTLLSNRRAKDGLVLITVTRASTGAAVFSATVALFGAGTGTLIQSTTTNAAGVALFTGVPSGPIDVRVFPPASVVSPSLFQRISVVAGDTVDVPVQLQ